MAYTYNYTSYTELTRIFIDWLNESSPDPESSGHIDLSEEPGVTITLHGKTRRFKNVDHAAYELRKRGLFHKPRSERSAEYSNEAGTAGRIIWDARHTLFDDE